MRKLLLTTSILLSIAAPAFAQTYDPSDEVVTVTRTPTPIENLPVQVDVIDVDRARDQGQFSLADMLAHVPGFQVPRTGPVGQQASIFSGGTESNHTLVLFDGIELNDPSAPDGAYDAGQDTVGDADRLEVVQGPMSALYGSGALGGVVNLIPRHGGPGAINPRLDVAGGSFNTLTANAGVDGTLGRFRYALNGEGYATDGFDTVPERISTHNGEKDGADITTFTGVFDYGLFDTLALDLLLRRREANVDYDPGDGFGDIAENPDSQIDSKSSIWRLGATWAATDALSMRLSGGQLDTDRVLKDFGVTGDQFHGNRDFVDLDATWHVSTWTLLAGGQSETDKTNAVSFGTPVVADADHWGAYLVGQGQIGPIDVTGAVRHDDYDGFGGKTTWRAGASYAVTDAARIYASYGTSYRAPALAERFDPFSGNPDLKPESAKTWEVGADAHFALFGQDNGLELGALYRSSDIDALINFASSFPFPFINIDRADIKYGEARLAVHPTDWLTARVVYANTDARNAVTDAQLLRRPKDAWSVELEANHGPFDATLAWRQVGERRDVTYDNDGFFFGTARVDSYNVLDASLSWQTSDSVRLYVNAGNLTDETYEAVNGFASAPRSVMVGVRVAPKRN